MDFTEGVGESSSPPHSGGSAAGFGNYDVRKDVYTRLINNGCEEGVSNPNLRELLDSHFNRLPPSYGLDVNLGRAEDVLLHHRLLTMAKNPEKNRPAYHIRFMESMSLESDNNDGDQFATAPTTATPYWNTDTEENLPTHRKNCVIDFEPCSRLEDLNLDVGTGSKNVKKGYLMHNSSRQEIAYIPIHEVIFCTLDKPKLLSQLSAMLSDIGLNIREAHVFSTTDGYSLDVFVVDGWPVEDTGGLYEAMERALAMREGSWFGSSHSHSSVEKALSVLAEPRAWEIDRRLLKIRERIASGSCGDLYHGVYLGEDVAVKVLRSENLNDIIENEFTQEVAILREVQHQNVVRFIGACTKTPHLCIVTEYMPGGSLYDYLHKNHHVLKFSQLLMFAIDVCRGMEYLHEHNIIHRDLKTANLLMGNENVVKVADFGVARFQNQKGVMTAETGTYRWMAPEVINHQPYDQKADVFSFGIVLWELVTAKVPYESVTPLQAALGVRQGLRPELPKDTHPKLLNLMQRCWDAVPDNRPAFSKISIELEELLHDVKKTSTMVNGN